MNLSHITVQTLNKTANLYTVDNMIIFVNTDLQNDIKTLEQIRGVLRNPSWVPNIDHPLNKTIISSNNIFGIYIFHTLVSIVPEFIFDTVSLQSIIQNIEKYITGTIFENLTNNPHVINNIGFKFAYYSPSEIIIPGYRRNRDIQLALSGEKLTSSRIEYIKILTVDSELRIISTGDLMFNLLDFIKLSPDTVCQVSSGLSDLFKQITKNVEASRSGSTIPSPSPATVSSPFPLTTSASTFTFTQPTPAVTSTFTFPQNQTTTATTTPATTSTFTFPQNQTTATTTPATTSTFTFPQNQTTATTTPATTSTFTFPQNQTTAQSTFGRNFSQPQQAQSTFGTFSQPQQAQSTFGTFSQPQQAQSTFGTFSQPQQAQTTFGTFSQPQQAQSTFGNKTSPFAFRK